MAEAITTSHAEKRCAVVTGGNKGIGFEICKKLASQGVMVVLTARDEKKGNEALKRLKNNFSAGLSENNNNNVVFHQLNVVEPASIASLVDFIRSNFGKLDILVNNAGVGGLMFEGDVSILKEIILRDDLKLAGHEVPEIKAGARLIQTYDLTEECLQTNYYGVKQLIEACVPLLQLSSSPRIVNVSSFLGKLELLSNEWAKGVLRDGESLTEERVDEVLTEFLNNFKDSSTVESKGYCKTDINCNTGFLTAAEGAEGPVELALLPDGGPSGLYFMRKEVTTF
ncbi:hypothetical protein ACH5RR_024038 [Cinchona calisaya]|uniref:(+)-neomenthol dehydrogenase n=1 Tax=Cinchona calisaya TaxID=153742 RepID=A0ABD2ZE72_9GENT